MGTNFYLQRKEPRLVYDQYHIAKTSCGWKPLFEAYTQYDEDDDRPQVQSIADIKHLFESGEFTIVDEYDEEYSWEEFDKRVLQHGNDEHNANQHHYSTDRDGFEFCHYEFF